MEKTDVKNKNKKISGKRIKLSKLWKRKYFEFSNKKIAKKRNYQNKHKILENKNDRNFLLENIESQ